MFRYLCWFAAAYMFATPPDKIPEDLYDAFTLNGRILVCSFYKDDSRPSDVALVYDVATIENLKQKALLRQNGYYGPTDQFLYEALDLYAPYIMGKKIGIIGSANPWYEAVVLAYGGHPVSIDYNKIISEHPSIRTLTVSEFDENPETFDAIFSISSIEHDGLGRYGDPINPWADLEAMEKTKRMLNPQGVLFLSVPTGLDYLFWNAHRVYGHIRLPMLLNGWQVLHTVGRIDLDGFSDGYHQPVFVLSPN